MVLVAGPAPPPAVPEDPSGDPTDATIDLFLAVMGRLHQHLVERSAEFDLPPPQARALHHLGQPRTMGELADMLCCDASNVTGIVDRLEARGIVERQVVPGDRRVKRIALTGDGRRLWQAHHERLVADLPLVAGLSAEGRRTLHDLLAESLAAAG
ncbi:MAG TPA: MarR family transcriptional regulator [Acidimicrobiales bacterium]|jgi:DNA-binding MarR family transcriptional regulator|nr:MarR family transcriptional regulator [Acidimicrobiales bacterium]